MKLYLFEPYDVLTFGGLRHFGAGESHVQKAEFPPPIMRFFELFEKVYGVFLYKDGEFFLPLPFDCVRQRKKEETKVFRLPHNIPPVIKGERFISEDGKLIAFEQIGSGFIKWSDFVKFYLEGEEGNFDVYGLKDFIRKELRVGIALNKDTRTSEEGMLYSQDFLRFDCQIGLLAGEPRGRLYYNTMGGEKKIAKFVEETEPMKELNGSIHIKRDKVYGFYCLSHLFVDGGLEMGKEIKICGLKFKVEWYFGSSEWVSGFAKPFLQMLKPGSLLWLRALEEGGLKRLCQIESKPPVNNVKGKIKREWNLDNFLEKGWNYGILVEVKL